MVISRTYFIYGIQDLTTMAVAMVLNPTPDHLERHKTMKNYAATKCRVFSHMRDKKMAILPFAKGAENSLEFTIVRPFNWIGPTMYFIPGIDGPREGVPRVLACFSNIHT